MKNKIIKIVTGTLACLSIFAIGTYGYHKQNIKLNNQEPIIFTEITQYDELYDFSDNKVLTEHSDLVVIGKITNMDDSTNYNPTAKKYVKATTPGTLEVMKVLKTDTSEKLDKIEFLNIGGTIKYTDYEKSLLPAQKAKRDYLMEQNGISKLSKSNMYVKQEVKNQIELEEDKTYIMYLYYNEDYDKYMVVNQPYGIKEYDQDTGKILNHVTNGVETLEEVM